ncbi:restriction endonuclease, partial [Aeromonas veronii]|uniref:restriction endonuclease n=1 Tax=Aeromonas veronii TaxID=654 RepID=UPI0030063B9A
MMPVVLSVLQNGESLPLRQVYQGVCDHYAFTPEQLAHTLPSGRQTTVRSRVGWAKTYLVKAGLIEQPKRGICLITERGKAALASGHTIDNHYLAQFNEFIAFTKASNEPAGNTQQDLATLTDIPYPEPASTPQELIEQALTTINRSLADELLVEILAMSPRFFEQLVVDLMVAMGYGGSGQEAGQTTRANSDGGSDGGIDGIIKEDKLGLDSIYLQAKRYADKTVGRPEIQAFAGALDLHRARKGVFITTSGFSREAREYVGLIEKRIVLIDGSCSGQLNPDTWLGRTSAFAGGIPSLY